MDPVCPQCDVSSNALLRLILLCEIIRVDAATLEIIADVLQHLGLVDLTDMDEERDVLPALQGPPRLRLVRSAPERRRT